MRLHRFYVREVVGSKKEIVIESADLLHQISKVFRLGIGDKVVIFDGSGSDYESEIAEMGKITPNTVTFRVLSTANSRYVPTRKIYLCAAVVKKDNFEFIVEKATELGVTDIVPVLAERTEKKALNEERLQKIAIESSEQSGRGNLPTIHKIMDLTEAIQFLTKQFVTFIAFHTEGSVFPPEELGDGLSIAVLIGPEGGWSPNEVDMFHKNKIQVRCLGPQVLKAETAVVAALSQVVFRV
ncbi:MAG: RsmE family RNA methyltransferase [Candidatus Taylorbacteria bacterium]|nr:RsmE family RNA methyltransferase [Candidatus Taylorbacteria bacterium]